MPTLPSTARPASAGFLANDAGSTRVVELRERLAATSRGGPERSRARHTARGKLLPRDRIDYLLDTGKPLLEIAPLAAWGPRRSGPGSGRHRRHRPRERSTLHDRLQRRDEVKGGTYYPSR
jgi:3-methylcrotonyl-CoA carboxylase beta subunit